MNPCTTIPAPRWAVTAATAAISVGTVLGAASPAVAAPSISGCGANKYVQEISAHPVEGPDYIISVTPTQAARDAGGVDVDRDVTVSMWHQIQSCVPGLYDGLADSIWQQLECHQYYPYESWTGPTYDLETWRQPLLNPGAWSYAYTRCLNRLSPDGPENGTPGYGNNFPGYLDLAESNRNIG